MKQINLNPVNHDTLQMESIRCLETSIRDYQQRILKLQNDMSKCQKSLEHLRKNW